MNINKIVFRYENKFADAARSIKGADGVAASFPKRRVELMAIRQRAKYSRKGEIYEY